MFLFIFALLETSFDVDWHSVGESGSLQELGIHTLIPILGTLISIIFLNFIHLPRVVTLHLPQSTGTQFFATYPMEPLEMLLQLTFDSLHFLF